MILVWNSFYICITVHWFRIAYRSTWRQMELQNERIQITTWKYQMQIYTKNNKYGWIACNDRENSHFRRCYTFIIIHRYFPIEKCLEFICNVHLIWMADTDKHIGAWGEGASDERQRHFHWILNTDCMYRARLFPFAHYRSEKFLIYCLTSRYTFGKSTFRVLLFFFHVTTLVFFLPLSLSLSNNSCL